MIDFWSVLNGISVAAVDGAGGGIDEVRRFFARQAFQDIREATRLLST